MTGSAPETEVFTSYSRNFADVILRRLFRGQPHGFFVDVGPGGPQRGNDLYALYSAGWSGINVEPDAAAAERMRQLRPRDQTVVAKLSGIDSEQPSLASLLVEWAVRTVDVLRIDAGAATEAVLSGNDWERFRPRALLLVSRRASGDAGLAPTLRGVLQQRGYRHVLFDGMNDLYLEHGFEVPADFALPPNLFDGFVLDETATLRHLVAELEQEQAAGADREAGLGRALEAAVAAHDDALAVAGPLGDENRRLASELRQLQAENRRLRSAADRMQAELAVLNRLLEPLHGLSEQLERQRRSHEAERDRLLVDLERQDRKAEEELRRREIDLRAMLQRRDREQQVALQQRDLQLELERRQSALEQQGDQQARDAEIQALRVALASVYESSSWKLTKVWRGFGRLSRRLRR